MRGQSEGRASSPTCASPEPTDIRRGSSRSSPEVSLLRRRTIPGRSRRTEREQQTAHNYAGVGQVEHLGGLNPGVDSHGDSRSGVSHSSGDDLGRTPAVRSPSRLQLSRSRHSSPTRFSNVCSGTLQQWGHGTTRMWAGRSRRRSTAARSCSASTWPQSAKWPPASSRTSGRTARRSGA